MKYVFEISYVVDGTAVKTEATISGATIPTESAIVAHVQKSLHPQRPLSIRAKFLRMIKEKEVKTKSKRELKRELQKQGQA